MNEQKTPPYITVVRHNDIEYYGIIKIKSKQYITLYCLSNMPQKKQEEIVNYAKVWWLQSNRTIPISLFLREEMEEFEQYTKRFDTDSVTLVSGVLISLSDLPTKRIKRRNITLKKK